MTSTMPQTKTARSFFLTLLAATAGLACSRPGGPGLSKEFGTNSTVLLSGARCLPLLSAEVYPARSVVTHPGSGVAGGNIYFVSDLWEKFGQLCGGCHGTGQNQGNFSVTQDSFSTKVTEMVLEQRIETDDPSQYMPPSGMNAEPFSQRGPDDPVRVFADLLQLWIAQGSPGGQFYLSPPDGGADDAADGGTAAGGTDGGAPQGAYTMTPDEGATLTNLGTCLPNQYVVGTNGDAMDRLDTFFAQATSLPVALAQTDLTTLESDTLARNGVVSYVPAYPLWSDSAGKMRYVRTPHNQPIVFDKSTQTFQIPPNTRFYKTFLKQITDINGKQAYRKIETRLIVSRPDTTASDGTVQQNALFGTYIWNDTETAATLQQDPLRDGTPFSDRLLTYNIDEPRAAAIQASTPSNQNLEYALDTATPPVRRHYAVPGSPRCIQCHMGSASASFVLGFLPVQIATHPRGQNGVIEAMTGDELTQLQRLIDYNVITGISSPDDVLPLEKTQLPRTPRNGYELNAQAYMLGNCSHCHNPRGFPTTKAPVLKDLLDFLPRHDGGGIFQFPLDRTSPLRARGDSQDIPIPYITPSLRDIPEQNSSTYKSKYEICAAGETEGWCTKPTSNSPYIVFVDAPWRSLIYRNTDTPFDYVDDLAIFPHMPMDTPGYDCRVAQILGDWMVSIPAVNPNAANENATPDPDIPGPAPDDTPQPYTEVLPSDPAYASAQAAATKRLAQYHAGHRYNFCPDTSDIVDPDVTSGALQSPAAVPVFDNTVSPPQVLMIADGVPAKPHWVVTDQTDPPGPWYPRGYNWPDALLNQIADASGSGVLQADLQTVVNDLQNVYLDDDTRMALTTPVPFTTWQAKPGCDFSQVHTVGSYQGAERPMWMDHQTLDPNAPVLLQSPGAAVFTNICINCHGPQADAKGLLAEEISLMTGGNARVADFRSGLFGPEGTLGMNRTELFSPPNVPANYPATPDDLTARYMAWMALGGTKVQLPPQLLQVVAATQVAGISRSHGTISASANMLQLARRLCTDVLLSDPPNSYQAPLGKLPGSFPVDWSNATGLIGSNGDAEMWTKVCALNNRPVIRVLVPGSGTGSTPLPLNPQAQDWSSYWSGATSLFVTGTSLYWGTDGASANGIGNPIYPAGSPLMDQRGQISTLDLANAGNLFPMCVQEPPAGSDAHAAADALLQRIAGSNTGGNVIPYCPAALFTTTTNSNGNLINKWQLAPFDPSSSMKTLTFTDANKWALRGAINAGLAVFLYIDQLSQNGVPQPLYNQCELLSSSTGARP